MNRKYLFYYILKYVGKGVQGSLKKLHVKNQQSKILKSHIQKEAIEEEIIEYSTKHFK